MGGRGLVAAARRVTWASTHWERWARGIVSGAQPVVRHAGTATRATLAMMDTTSRRSRAWRAWMAARFAHPRLTARG